jgi:hypothetical protein
LGRADGAPALGCHGPARWGQRCRRYRGGAGVWHSSPLAHIASVVVVVVVVIVAV